MQLGFDNTFVRELPADDSVENRRRQVHGACYSRVFPTPVPAPKLLAHSREMAAELGLTDWVDTETFAQVFAGNRVLPGMEPFAACYGGHQFGSWAGQLGDGRAISLGELRGQNGQRWELQLKGAGPTPYSRSADGRAVVRSSVREFLCSEAMFHLGVPTTRALSLVATGEQLVRDMFYDGNPRSEPGAVVCRVAPSFVRFGNFQIFDKRNQLEPLRALTDYVIRHHFPELTRRVAGGANGAAVNGPSSHGAALRGEQGRAASQGAAYAAWFEEVCRRTADLVVEWLRVGFVHGVLNTDNMSILGLTIDYGPYGWLEDYDPNWTPNTTDASRRRYRFGRQPAIAAWNLARLGEAIVPLVGDSVPLERALASYAARFDEQYQLMMARKLGLAGPQGVSALLPIPFEQLEAELTEVLQLAETDMTIFFRSLAALQPSGAWLERADQQLIEPLLGAYYVPEQLNAELAGRIACWLRKYVRCALASGVPHAERRKLMNAVNPKYVLRNYLAQLAIDRAEQGDGSLVYELLEVLRRPYDEQPGKERFAEQRPEWARTRPGCSMLSCSS